MLVENDNFGSDVAPLSGVPLNPEYAAGAYNAVHTCLAVQPREVVTLITDRQTRSVAGAFAAFASWAFYGSGAAVDAADPKALTSLRFSALAGAFLVGVVGAKWITNEAEKRLLKRSVKVAATKVLSNEKSQEIDSGTPLEVLQSIAQI